MMMRSLTVFPAASLLILWAMIETGLCNNVMPCPAHCSGSIGIFMPDGSLQTLNKEKGGVLIRIRNDLRKASWNGTLVIVKLGDKKVKVPASFKFSLSLVVKKYPDLLAVLIEIIKGEAKSQKIKRTAPPSSKLVVKTTTTTKRTKRPTTKRSATTKRTVRTATTTKKLRATTKRTVRTTTTTKKRRATTKRAIKTTTTKKTKRDTPKAIKKATSTNKPGRVTHVPAMNMPNPGDRSYLITAGSGVDTKVLIMLGYMMSQPNYFAVIYPMLLQLGITFPSLTGPIYQVTWGQSVVPLPRPFVVSYAFTVDNKFFNLPKDAKGLAIYLSHHMDQFSAVAVFLRQLGASFPVDGMGRITGFSIFNIMYHFQSAITTTISIEHRRFGLPKDINLILAAVKNNPSAFFKIQMLLEAFGVKFVKKGAGFTQALYRNATYNVNTVRGVTITIEKKQYDIPADLETIFKKAEGFSVGALIAALQEKGVPIEVDEKTGVIVGITINKVKIPFPVSIDLRFKLDDKVYVIPRDLGKLVTVLEKKGMPSKILFILYTRYGVIPVRDSNGIVIAISFNGKQVKVKAEPMTTVVLRGQKFLLPRDTTKMVELVHSKQKDEKMGFDFLKALKVAGFMLINDDDGAMRSIQKGAQIIKLGMEIRIMVTYGTTAYHVPKDLMRLVKDIRSSGPNEVRKVIEQLKAFDVEVKKEGSRVSILFNSVRYEVDLKSGSVKG